MSPEDIAYNEGVRNTLVSIIRTLESKKHLIQPDEEQGVKLTKSILAEALVLANGTRTRRISN